jgi:hypothetical protein
VPKNILSVYLFNDAVDKSDVTSNDGMKSPVFWDITQRSPLKVNRVSEERGSAYVPPKRRLTFNGVYGVIPQKTELFITTAVGTSNPTNDRTISE